MPYYSNGTMNIREFMIILGLKWLTRTDTIWHLVLALFGSLFLPSFFLVRLKWNATFGLLNLAPRLLATAPLPKLVPGPRRVPGQRHWSLFRVHFFRYWACPTLRSFSQLLFLWARPHQRPHLLPLLQSQPVSWALLFSLSEPFALCVCVSSVSLLNKAYAA